MEPEKVAVLLPRLYTGGVARVAIEVVRRLERIDGLEFKFYTNRRNTSWHEDLDAELREFSPLPYPELAFRRPDIKAELEAHDLVFNHNLYLNKLGSKIDTPMLSVNHTLHHRDTRWRDPGTLKWKFQRKLEEEGVRNMQHVDRVVSVSDAIKHRVENIYKASSSRIYNAGDMPWTEYSERDGGYIFKPHYSTPTIDRIARNRQVKALGSGYDNVEGLGRPSDKEMAEAFKNCSFIISDSFHEGCPLPPLEAAFCGKPAVLRDAGGNEEIVKHGETGFIARNTREFHEYVDRLWQDEELRKEMGRNAYEFVKDRFTWDRAAREYLEEMNDLMKTDFSLEG